jgi:leucyl aminopeptidase
MKFDMAGGAAVIGVLRLAAILDLPMKIVGLVPASENVIGGSAMRPGDIIRAASGKTVEIVNTDAEGRLLLADALHLAGTYRPAAVIDLATLTGACVVALGSEYSGLFSNDDDLKRRLREAGERSGERLWELPLGLAYLEATKSPVADLKNSGGREGGASTAAAFLEQFVGKTPWCHVDIAGTANVERDKDGIVAGATGVGVRLLEEFLSSWTRVTRLL